MKETAKTFKKIIMDEFDGYLKTIGFKKIRHRADKGGFAVICRYEERYISFNASLDPRDYPAFYPISFGEGSIDFPESDWNAIDLLLIVKSKSLKDFEQYKGTFIIMRPTMRAADAGESARFTGIFLASSFFCSQAFAYARPLSAANASRWAFHRGN